MRFRIASSLQERALCLALREMTRLNLVQKGVLHCREGRFALQEKTASGGGALFISWRTEGDFHSNCKQQANCVEN